MITVYATLKLKQFICVCRAALICFVCLSCFFLCLNPWEAFRDHLSASKVTRDAGSSNLTCFKLPSKVSSRRPLTWVLNKLQVFFPKHGWKWFHPSHLSFLNILVTLWIQKTCVLLTLFYGHHPQHWVLHFFWTSGCWISQNRGVLPGFLLAFGLWLVIRNTENAVIQSVSTRLITWSAQLSTSVTLTGRAAQDGLFDDVTARHSPLKALGPLLQEPLSCYHLQLPANMTPTADWTKRTSLVCLQWQIHLHSGFGINNQWVISGVSLSEVKDKLRLHIEGNPELSREMSEMIRCRIISQEHKVKHIHITVRALLQFWTVIHRNILKYSLIMKNRTHFERTLLKTGKTPDK